MKFLFLFTFVILAAAAAAHDGHDHHDHDHKDHHEHEHKKSDDHHEHKAGDDHKDHHDHKTSDEHKDKKGEDHKEHETGDAHPVPPVHKKEAKVVGGLKALETEGIIPDVIKTLPKKPLSVKFSEHEVNFGNELTPTQVKEQPKVTWEAEKDTYYTLAMVDPDAPSRKEPKFREVNHWLVANIHGSDVSTGETITAFLGSGPPKDTGFHRYVFLLFKQPKKLDVESEPKTPALSREHRLNFSIGKFAEKHNLGDALAGNFYKAQWDAYVDERNKKIKA